MLIYFLVMMSKKNQNLKPPYVVPVLSFRTNHFPTDTRDKFPTYISQCIGWFPAGLSIEGKLEGQPFKADYPTTWSPEEKHPSYYHLEFPAQGMGLFQRLNNAETPERMLNYIHEEPEAREEERASLLNSALLGFNYKGRFSFDSDSDFNTKHFQRLKTIADFLKPTISVLYEINRNNHKVMYDSMRGWSIESLVIPIAYKG